MCGIAGIFDSAGLDREHSKRVVESAITEIKHRGPDDQGLYTSSNSALGMCRLSIIDVAGGQQPNFGSQGKVVSVFNGEIYNFKELRARLIVKGYPLKGVGDSECIPFLYEEYGDEFPNHLQGMFAIALWDHENNRGLLVRDRFGKKPLWFHREGTKVSFASEVKGLLRLGIPKTLDRRRIPEYLQFGYINAPRSIFQDVTQVRPGALVVVERGMINEKTYWRPNITDLSSMNFVEAKEQAHSLIKDAVKTRLVSERPIGAFLSGGIDSSLVTAIMSREFGAKTHTFSIGFENPEFDESGYASAVATQIGTQHHEKIIRPDTGLIIEKIAKVLDHPFADSSIIPTYLLSEFARNDVVVALGGDGGDEAFGGYTRYRVCRALNKVNFLLALSPAPMLSHFLSNDRRLEKFLKHLRSTNARDRYLGFQSLIQPSEIKMFLANELQSLDEDLDLIEMWQISGDQSELRSMQKFDLATYLPGDLMYKADMASMANSLELRSPLLDYRVVEFGLSLSDKFKIHNGVSKWILREILYEYVPKKLVDRPKMGFGIPQAEWLRRDLSDLVHSTLFASDASIRSWIDVNQLRKIVDEHKRGLNRDRVIWPILMLELWARNWLT